MIKDIIFTVAHNKRLLPTVFELKLTTKEPLPFMRAGQFVHIETGCSAMPLRRPFCLHKYDKNSITLIVAIVGKGTELLAALKKGDTLKGIIPCGNGFVLKGNHKKVVLVGGGIGCAPLLGVPQDYPDREYRSYLGFSCAEMVLFKKDFAKVSKVTVITEDGKCGIKGFVTDALKQDISSGEFIPDVILACGAHGMIKAVDKVARDFKIPAYMTGEERMGCGIGACLVCACAVRENGEIKNKKACLDGPVFLLEDMVL